MGNDEFLTNDFRIVDQSYFTWLAWNKSRAGEYKFLAPAVRFNLWNRDSRALTHERLHSIFKIKIKRREKKIATDAHTFVISYRFIPL